MDNENRLISDSQKELYSKLEKRSAGNRLGNIKGSLAKFFGGNKLQIIDIGGASGVFANSVRNLFIENSTDCLVNVIDYCRYDEWSSFENIVFIEGSAFSELEKFLDNSVDIIFCNYVLHHLVTDTYKKTRKLQKRVMTLVYKKLKTNGVVFIDECYYQNPVLQNLSIPSVYFMSSSTLPFIINLSRTFGSKSAGVGVCFLSKRIWQKEFSRCGFNIIELHSGKMRWVKPLLIQSEFFSFVLTKIREEGLIGES